jgi:hypothetical protein
METIKKIKKISAKIRENEFCGAYAGVFQQMRPNEIYTSFVEKIPAAWKKIDGDADKNYICCCSYSVADGFYHTTISGRNIHFFNGLLTIDFGEGSFSFAYQWLSNLIKPDTDNQQIEIEYDLSS